MRTLGEILDLAKSGEHPTYDELLYSLVVMEALSTFDGSAFLALREVECGERKPILNGSAVFQYEERFNRLKRALLKSPKEWLGWDNDPANPEYQRRRGAALKLFNKIVEKTGCR